MQAPLVFSGFPLGYCYPSSANQLIVDTVSLTHAEVPENVTGVAYGPTAPMGDTVKLYYSTVFNRMYEFRAGMWMARYDNDGIRNGFIITEDSEPEIKSWDNASGADATFGAEGHTGPFWEINHDYDGRFILGKGTLPDGSIVLAIGGVGGADAIVQASDEVGLHRHFITMRTETGAESYLPAQPSEAGEFSVGGSASMHFTVDPDTLVGQTREGGGNGATPSVVQPMNIMPPYRVAYVVKRTSRIWLTLTP